MARLRIGDTPPTRTVRTPADALAHALASLKRFSGSREETGEHFQPDPQPRSIPERCAEANIAHWAASVENLSFRCMPRASVRERLSVWESPRKCIESQNYASDSIVPQDRLLAESPQNQ